MKRMIVAFVMIILMISAVELLPLFTFALPQNGDQGTTEYVDTLVGSDGGYFFRSGVQTSIKYYSDGSCGAFTHENYGGPRQHSLIKPDGEAAYYGYCIEQGESFPDAQRYTGVGWVNDSYFSKLPSTVQTGIMLATIFGWQPSKTVPVSGCNEDDWYWATQVIIWEYQQKLRSSPTNIQANGHVSSNYFQSTLAGRPAEKCYSYILASMENYQKIPVFTTMDSSNAPLQLLKWDSSKQLWSLTVNDTNQIGFPLISDEPTLKIERSGNQYTFSSTTKLEAKTIKFRKDVPLPSHEMLIWGGANRTQAISTGAADPIQFFGRFRTEESGTLEIVKTSEDGKEEGFIFTLVDQNGQSTNLKTNQVGLISIQLYPGEYLVSEELTSKYRTTETTTVEIKEYETTHLEIFNILKKGQIQIQKNVIDTIASSKSGEKGAVFQIHSADYATFADAPWNLKDELITDVKGLARTKELPLGNYVVHQKKANKNITLSQDIPIVLENDVQTLPLTIDNQLQKAKIQVFKMDTSKLPLVGAEFVIRTAEDILQADGTLKYIKGSLIDVLVTDVNGLTCSQWLYPGMYELKELEAPEGYLLPKNPVTTISLTTENQTASTFFKQVSIENSRVEQSSNTVEKSPNIFVQSPNTVEQSPNTSDVIRRTSTRMIEILMLMSLIGIGVLAFMLIEQNKTLR